MKTETDTEPVIVHVVAWEYDSGGGFDWYKKPGDADKAMDEERRNAEELADHSWTWFRFDVRVTSYERATEEIGDNLEEAEEAGWLNTGIVFDARGPDQSWRKQVPKKFGPFYDVNVDEDEDTILATVDFFSMPHHAMFVRVERKDDTSELMATRDPYGRMEDIERLYEDTPLMPLELPNIDGKWLLVIHPWGR